MYGCVGRVCRVYGCVSVGGCLPDVDLGEGRVAAQCVGVWVCGPGV